MTRKGWSAYPETMWGESLDVATAEANKAANRLHRAGVGATVKLTKRAKSHGVTVRGSAYGTIVGFGNHRWTVRVKPDSRKTASSYHARFWEPARRPASKKR
jgi:hypothetical protein